jgi:hypothetical protein
MRLIKLLLIGILALPLVLSGAGSGCVESSADVAASLVQAEASAARCLHLPAGVYTSPVLAGGVWLSATADNLEVYGDGIGKSVLRVTDGLTLTSDLIALRLLGKGQHIHDLTVQVGTGYSGPWGIGGINIYSPAEHALLERIEVVGGYSFDGARGYGIGTYQPYNYLGGAQWVTIRDNFIHDGLATGIGINSNNNIIENNHVARVGLNSLSHGVYAQGGNNFYEGNTIDQATGWAIHGHKQVPNLDGSGDRIIGNLILNPGLGGVVIDSTGSPPLTRYATIQGNTLRNTGGHRSSGIWCNGVPCVIDGNVLEDTYVTNGSGWIEDNAGSIITNNILTTLNAPDGATNYSMIRSTAVTGATIANNRLVNGQYGGGIVVSGARHTIQGNTVLMTASGSQGLYLSGDMLLVQGNRLESTAGAYVLAIGSPLTNLTMTGNYLRRAGDLCNLNLSGVTGRIADNVYDGTFRYTGGINVVR